MKTIGLIGGMSWQSTTEYYKTINQEVNSRLGANHSAKILLKSLDFEPLHQLQVDNNWEEIGIIIAEAAMDLEFAGADTILICANTMHKIYDFVQTQINIPIIHIAQATSAGIKTTNVDAVGLLGTQYTMTEGFLKKVYNDNNINILVPSPTTQQLVHSIIIDELCKGIITEASFGVYLRAITEMLEQGAKGVILGCTEIPLLINEANFDNYPDLTKLFNQVNKRNVKSIFFYDTAKLHCKTAIDFALD